jgi:hypothetical protein
MFAKTKENFKVKDTPPDALARLSRPRIRHSSLAA